MGKQKYTREFREAAVRLVIEQKQTIAAASQSLGMPHNTLVAWVGQARKGRGVFAPQEEKDLLQRVRELEAECRRLRMERDILKKATALFAQQEGGRA